MDGFEPQRQDWMSRYRARRDVRRELRADRRARRRARMFGASPDDAARQAESGMQRGGYFTTKTTPKP